MITLFFVPHFREKGGHQMDSNPKGTKNKGEPPKRRSVFTLIIAALVLTIVFNLIYTQIANAYLEEIPYSDFTELLEQDKIDSLEFKSDRILILTREGCGRS